MIDDLLREIEARTPFCHSHPTGHDVSHTHNLGGDIPRLCSALRRAVKGLEDSCECASTPCCCCQALRDIEKTLKGETK